MRAMCVYVEMLYRSLGILSDFFSFLFRWKQFQSPTMSVMVCIKVETVTPHRVKKAAEDSSQRHSRRLCFDNGK